MADFNLSFWLMGQLMYLETLILDSSRDQAIYDRVIGLKGEPTSSKTC